MGKRILLCVDISFAPTTQQAIRVVSDLIDCSPSSFHFLLLHVIPITQVMVEHNGPFFEQYTLFPPTPEQHKQAEEVLQQASCTLQEYGIQRDHIERLIRVGTPAEEISKVARERDIDLIVVGSQGDSWLHNLRRFILGSTSRRVLKFAPCPVMVVTLPQLPQNDLVSLYEEAIKRDLEQHPQQLLVITPQTAAQRFLPPTKKDVGHKELQAATTALEHLAKSGRLIRRDVQGNVHYIND